MQKLLTLTPRTNATKPLSLKAGPQRVRVDDILLREGADTRPLNARHVVDLAESIAALGLLEPLVIDTKGHLLAGAHRLAAVQILTILDAKMREEYFREVIPRNNDGYSTKPFEKLIQRIVAIPIPSWDRQMAQDVPTLVLEVGEKDSKRTLAIEMAENTVRRSYTKDEIEALAKRLKAEGYKSSAGKPKKGERAVITILQAAVGKSARQIKRILEGGKSGKSDWDKAYDILVRAAARIVKEGKGRRGEKDVKLIGLADRIQQITGTKEDGSKET